MIKKPLEKDSALGPRSSAELRQCGSERKTVVKLTASPKDNALIPPVLHGNWFHLLQLKQIGICIPADCVEN
jgi:hypothetical protein